MIMQS
jgi:hypothetical protein